MSISLHLLAKAISLSGTQKSVIGFAKVVEQARKAEPLAFGIYTT
jgi:hypothetical protein